MRKKSVFLLLLFLVCAASFAHAQSKPSSKKISKDLFGIFFEDISYAADGGLYAELIQNRSFEYSASDNKRDWNSLTAWEYFREGFAYGDMSVDTASPLNPNNPHYVTLNIEDAGSSGIGLMNAGFDGIAIKSGEKYNFAAFIRQLSPEAIPISVRLQSDKGVVYGEANFSTQSKNWKRYTATITANQTDANARLVVIAKAKGKLNLDVVSLFPQKTFKNRPNGLREDLAQVVADLKPKFMRFPGGCLVHGDGLGNMYHWKNTVGPIEARKEKRNIWRYHQTNGLGYYEYFQFCEDIDAKPVPVVAAAVSCQNSGGTWSIGGTGQRGIPLSEMKAYIQDVLDLIEYANGSPKSKWGAKRAAAGHPAPFNLEYLAIGNEDKITPVFRERFKMIYDAVKAKHPEIKLIGTSGPFHSGEDYDLGWNFANQLKLSFVDEHYYENPEWFLQNNVRYDSYDRQKAKIYVGEYASKGNTLFNALAEASYMTALERNGDVVTMASYAPLLANEKHTSWNPNLIYFNNTAITPTANYYVQKMFSTNQGDIYYSNIVSFDRKDNMPAASVVQDSESGDLILKIVNSGATATKATANLSDLGVKNWKAILQLLTGKPEAKNTAQNPNELAPRQSEVEISKFFTYDVPPYSLSVFRIKTGK